MTGTDLPGLAERAVGGVLCSLADAADLLAGYGVSFRCALLIGGGARLAAVREIASDILGREVKVPASRVHRARHRASGCLGTGRPRGAASMAGGGRSAKRHGQPLGAADVAPMPQRPSGSWLAG